MDQDKCIKPNILTNFLFVLYQENMFRGWKTWFIVETQRGLSRPGLIIDRMRKVSKRR